MAKVPFKSREDIEKEAEKLLRESDAYSAPVDPIKVANLLKMRIFNAAFEDNSIAGILAKRGPNITMLINANDPAYRKRFTIAHEIGHRILKHFTDETDHTDHRIDLYRGATSEKGEPEEVQANYFAAALLMPASLVRDAFARSPDVDSLAELFQVSNDAMGIRLSTLELV